MSIERFVAEASKPETVAALNAAVATAEPDPRGCLVYPLAMVERIGHLGIEPHYLASMFGDRYRRIVIVTAPRRLPGVNRDLYDMLATRFAMAETEHAIVPMLGILNQGVVSTGTYDLYLAAPNRFYRDYSAHRIAGGALRHLDLTDELEERARALLARLGLDREDRLVLLHARESSYVPDRTKVQHGEMRTVDIESFRPAVDRLVESGYAVLRVGHPGSPPFPHASERVVDLAHVPDRAPWMDVVVAARCRFGVTTMSGPEALLRGFGRPQLATNLIPTVYSHHLPGDRFLFKPVFRRDRPDPLSYSEVLAARFPNRLVAGPLPDADSYAAEGYRFEQVDAGIILAAVDEMIALDRGDAPPAETEAQRRFREMSAGYERLIEADERAKAMFADLYAYAHAGFGRLSSASPPGFLA